MSRCVDVAEGDPSTSRGEGGDDTVLPEVPVLVSRLSESYGKTKLDKGKRPLCPPIVYLLTTKSILTTPRIASITSVTRIVT